ncbi:unnamed protein product [Calypogeia fissa]
MAVQEQLSDVTEDELLSDLSEEGQMVPTLGEDMTDEELVEAAKQYLRYEEEQNSSKQGQIPLLSFGDGDSGPGPSSLEECQEYKRLEELEKFRTKWKIDLSLP